MNIEDHNHLAKELSTKLDAKTFAILWELGFHDMGELIDYLKKKVD